MKKIIENATIHYKNGEKLIYDAIQITNKGIYTGRIIRHHEKVEFQDNRFIPRDEIQQIMIFNEQGNVKHIEL
jgi:hypothetical protein